MARNLGNLLSPRGEPVLSSVQAFSGAEASSGPLPDFGHEHDEPIDPMSVRPADFEKGLEALLGRVVPTFESFMQGLIPTALSPFASVTGLSAAAPLAVTLAAPVLAPLTQLMDLGSLSVSLATEAFKSFSFEKPLLYSDWKDQNLKSLREAFPEVNQPVVSSVPSNLSSPTTPSMEKIKPSVSPVKHDIPVRSELRPEIRLPRFTHFDWKALDLNKKKVVTNMGQRISERRKSRIREV